MPSLSLSFLLLPTTHTFLPSLSTSAFFLLLLSRSRLSLSVFLLQPSPISLCDDSQLYSMWDEQESTTATLFYLLSLQSERICLYLIHSLPVSILELLLLWIFANSVWKWGCSRPSPWLARLNYEEWEAARVGRDRPGLLTVGLISCLALPLHNQRIHLPFPQFFSPFCYKFPSFLSPWLLNSVPFFPLCSTKKHTSKVLYVLVRIHTEREPPSITARPHTTD